MKIAISSPNGNPDSPFQERFGRSEFFLLFDEGKNHWQDLKNPAVHSRGGAGPQVVQLLADSGVDAVISGRFGPKAFEALQAAEMTVYLGRKGTPRELVEAVRQGNLERVTGPTGPGHHA